jgi:hypothetical protein
MSVLSFNVARWRFGEGIERNGNVALRDTESCVGCVDSVRMLCALIDKGIQKCHRKMWRKKMLEKSGGLRRVQEHEESKKGGGE